MDDILLQVNKPARYIGAEWNSPQKNFDAAGIKFALCFPELYEVGMSNLGVRILYGLLNSLPDVSCERFFSPDTDMEAVLRGSGQGVLSLESKRPMNDFDFVGFSLGYELDYTNVLNLLDLGGIPLKASQRRMNHPLIIGGGPCVLNPEPLHDFFDLFVIGEAEEVILEIIDLYKTLKEKFRAGKMSKEDLLFSFCAIEGVYVPSLYEVKYSNDGKITEFRPRIEGLPAKIKKRFVKDLDNAYFPSEWLLPYIQIVHDRISLEIMRGCPNRCRFCQARSAYFPLRQRRPDKILDLAVRLYKATGYEEISLAGLSVSDYPDLGGLCRRLTGLFKEEAVALAFPSIKPTAMTGELSSLIATVKKTALTFAPEAGSARLRGILGKDFNLEDFFKAAEQAYRLGYQHIKLYFMIGLPYEEERDLDEIINLAEEVSQLRRRVARGPAQVNISINTLIPKPHTAFQWFKMADAEVIKSKQDYLKKKLKNKRLKLSFHNRYMSILEGVFSRGDRRLSEVLYNAYNNGARFDAEGNHFSFDKWLAAFSSCGINPAFYLEARAVGEALPWDFLDTGISRDILAGELNKLVDIT